MFREANKALYHHSIFHCFSFSFEQCVSIRKVDPKDVSTKEQRLSLVALYGPNEDLPVFLKV
jgi:hypothetical protein